jgi:hypothetical protein
MKRTLLTGSVCALALASLVAAASAGSNGTLQGTFVDSQTHHAIAGATVTIRSRFGTEKAVTDSTGRFNLFGVFPANYTLSIEAHRYALCVEPNFDMRPGETWRLRLLGETVCNHTGSKHLTQVGGYTTDTYTLN